MKLRLLLVSLCTCGLLGCATQVPPANSTVTKATAPPALSSLAGTAWTTLEIDGRTVLSSSDGWSAPSISFNADGRRVAGDTGVNRFMGPYEQQGTQLSFGPLATTMRAGPPSLMAQERVFTQALDQVTHWRRDGTRLVLVGATNDHLLVLARAAPDVAQTDGRHP